MSIKSEHKNCLVLGRYCWDHKVKTEAGIPGWPIGHNGSFTHYSPWASDGDGNGYTDSIIWANGEPDTRRSMYLACAMCNKNCKYPVRHGISDSGDNYKEIKKRLI